MSERQPTATPPPLRAATVSFLVLLALFSILGCKRRVMLAPLPSSAPAAEITDYTIQVGVFASEDNAARLKQKLEGRGLNVRVVAHESGFFKVQVGSFVSRSGAEREARKLLGDGTVDEYFRRRQARDEFRVRCAPDRRCDGGPAPRVGRDGPQLPRLPLYLGRRFR